MAKKRKFIAGEKSNKTDMDRLGLFREMGYITIGDPYPVLGHPKNVEPHYKQISVEGSKTKAGDQSGFFAPKFLRLFEGDTYETLAEIYRKWDKTANSKLIGRPFINGAPVKKDCGKGSFCATINPSPAAMSTALKKERKQNFKLALYSAPGKKGTGYGYLDVTIGKYIPCKGLAEIDTSNVRKEELKIHKQKMLAGTFYNTFPKDRYFDHSPYHEVAAAKQREKVEPTTHYAKHPDIFSYRALPLHDHGAQPGTINKLATKNEGVYIDPPYAVDKRKDVRNNLNLSYLPNSGPKSYVISSVIQTNLNKRLNGDNYKCLKSVIGFSTS